MANVTSGNGLMVSQRDTSLGTTDEQKARELAHLEHSVLKLDSSHAAGLAKVYQAKTGDLIPEKFYYYAYCEMSIKPNYMSNKLDIINVELKFTSVRRKAMNKELINDTCDAAALPKKNTLRLFFWVVAWVLATAGAAFGPRFLWGFDTLPTMLGVLIHIGIGFGMIRMFRQYLLRLDELQRKIQLDAMAQSLGVGLVVGVSYEMLEDIKLITFEPEISHLILLMSLTYCIGIILGNRRYQ